jgi:CheY-like chemotaxis protein
LDYYFSYNESEEIFDSSYSTYYDEIITRPHPQTIEQYKHKTQQQQQREKTPKQEGNLHDQKERKRILLVDDEPDSCITFQAVLEDAGFECIPYTDSLQALQEFRPFHYDLILLDIKMPALNGFELCKKIRELDKKVEVIFITASEVYYEQLQRQSYTELTNDTNINYVLKPIRNHELIRLVNMLIATNHIK